MLACCNTARLWKETCIGLTILEKNVICITFGQPLKAIPYVQETISEHPNFENTIHSIYDQEDIFPKLLRDNFQRMDKDPSMMPLKVNGNGSPPLSQLMSSESSLLKEVSIYSCAI